MPVVNNVVYKDFDTLFAAHPVTGKLNTKINSFADVQKSLQSIEKYLNELSKSVNSYWRIKRCWGCHSSER